MNKAMIIVAILFIGLTVGVKGEQWMAGRKKPKVSLLPGDAVSRDFFKTPETPPCQILIPPGRELNLFGVVTLSPSVDGKLDNPPAPIQVYGCRFNGDTNAKVQEQIMEVKP